MSVRDRTVKIEMIYDEPKVLAEKTDYKVFSYGIKCTDGTYVNRTGTAKDVEQFKTKNENVFYYNNGKDKIKVGETYKIYEESTDKDEKYWNVKSFIPVEEVKDSVQAGNSVGGGTKPVINGQRNGMMMNNSVKIECQEATRENRAIDYTKIEEAYNKLMDKMNKLENE